MIDVDGKAEFRGRLRVGDVTEAILGDGLLDPFNAEVQAIVGSHLICHRSCQCEAGLAT
jgi:hypothetical protein